MYVRVFASTLLPIKSTTPLNANLFVDIFLRVQIIDFEGKQSVEEKIVFYIDSKLIDKLWADYIEE